ncbi:MAG: GGDEF domain-containing protein [Lachnospiraceae bacterium]|nr:GGDEF domain-containing protein [Lachnospiraceae bacterium]
MAINRQSKSAVLTWIIVDVAFLAIVIVLLGAFLYSGRKSAISQGRTNLVWQVAGWADKVQEFIYQADSAASPFTYDPKELTKPSSDSKRLEFLRGMTDRTSFSHVCLFEGQNYITDELGSSTTPIDILSFSKDGYTKSTVVVSPVIGDNNDVNFTVCVPLEGRYYLAFTTTLSEMDDYFSTFAYSEYYFLAIISNDGKIYGAYSKYTDTDTPFLRTGNLVNVIENNSNKNDYYLFKARFIGRLDGSVAANYNGDERTFAFAPIGEGDLYLAMGLRQDYFERMCANYIDETRKVTLRLGCVIAMFALFVFGTFIFSSIRHKEQGRQLEDKADTDLLTDLNNKLATERKIQEYLDTQLDERGMMFIFDVDNFKKINDTMGHAFGDLMLKTLGKDIRSVFRASDIIGRIGGDEFVIFLKNINDDAEIMQEAKRLTAFFHDFKAGGDYVKYSATASIGVAIYPDDARNFKALYEAADQALYRSKKRGKAQLTFFNEAVFGESIKS